MRLLFDIETDDLKATKVWCVVTHDMDTKEMRSFRPFEIEQALGFLGQAEELIGHNIYSFDLPVLAQLHAFRRPPKILDTLLWSRASYPERKAYDFGSLRRDPTYIPKQMIGRHSLESWGHRLGDHKIHHDEWGRYSEEMLARCQQDVLLNVKLYEYLLNAGRVSEEAARWESECGWIIARQEKHGVRFDTEKAVELYARLNAHKARLEKQLDGVFAPWYVAGKEFVPKRDNQRLGYVAGAAMTKVELTEFSPGSRDHIADRLVKVRGWKPVEFTDNGRPKIDDDILAKLPWPECKLLGEYLMVVKRLGQVGEGTKAWLKLEKGGRLYGRVHVTGAVTSRMAHQNPNLAQVPASRSPYGPECRELFLPDEGQVLVGADASGLELRMLGHYLARWDGGVFAKEVVEGDPHTYMMAMTGIEDREIQKTYTYATLYGAGAAKQAKIMGKTVARAQAAKRRMYQRMPAMQELDKGLKASVKRGHLRLLDGRRADIRAEHMALNTLLQGGGGVAMKYGLVFADREIQAAGLVPGIDYEFVLNVHDEWQASTLPQHAQTVGEAMVVGIRKAGERLQLRLPLDAKYKVGANWKETH
jgi:DNA polymerase I-like protein with 3'-5' exonuclease and polymerase domains